MKTIHRRIIVGAGFWCVLLFDSASLAQPTQGCAEKLSAQIRVDSGHPWRPPFGVDRVGAPPAVHVELTAEQAPRGDYTVIAWRGGRESERYPLNLSKDRSPFYGTVQLKAVPTEVALHVRCSPDGRSEELKRQKIAWPEIEADAQARPDRQINPVDLGTILVPHDWLLLTGGQTALIDVAAISRTRDIPSARLRVGFEGGKSVEAALPLKANRRAVKELQLPLTAQGDTSALHVSLLEGDRELWKKDIRTMIVTRPSSWPAFGAVETKLRYDAPISAQDRKTGTSSSLDYEQGWDPKLNDVVVFLPNGTRFVFWRGSSYVPFWAGRYNTGFSYQWAETIAPPGYVDAVEPLQDKELRYSRVHVVESTRSRVHVRWTYQSVDVNYKSLDDATAEDFYFYPDGFGTRVVTLVSVRPQHYQLSEFIVLTPQGAFPFDVLPRPHVDLLSLDGGKKRIDFPLQPGSYEPVNIPFPGEQEGVVYHPTERLVAQSLRYRQQEGSEVSPARINAINRYLGKIIYPLKPVVYRAADHKNDAATPIYFSPQASDRLVAFLPFEDRGEWVTPAYWGDHWPLGRGALTGGAIGDRLYSSPSHFGLVDLMEPEPLSRGTVQTIDANGDARRMIVESRAWLIAKTDIPDAELLKWARSFSDPPSVQVTGARIDFPSYAQERRAIRLIVEAPSIQINLKPAQHLVNPVFELDQASKALTGVTLDGKALASAEYAWDGATLWVKASIDARGARINLWFQ